MPTQLPASWYASDFVSSSPLSIGVSKALAATVPLVYVHMKRNAAQQKNWTRPISQNAAGALTRSVTMPGSSAFSLLSASDSSMPLYSLYSAGAHSLTFSVVYMTHSMRMAAPI